METLAFFGIGGKGGGGFGGLTQILRKFLDTISTMPAIAPLVQVGTSLKDCFGAILKLHIGKEWIMDPFANLRSLGMVRTKIQTAGVRLINSLRKVLLKEAAWEKGTSE